MPPPPPPGRSNNLTFSLAAISPTPSCSAASFEVNSEPHTGARPSVRLCVGLTNGGTPAQSADVAVHRGVAGRAGEMRDIASSMPPNLCLRQGRRRPTPRYCAAGAGGITAVESCVSAAAKLRPATRTQRRYIAASANLPLLR